ncbi:hypothetical protein OMCYN_01256 [cyanobiont of Ornithocercus magnificus]|nr:hypothetical protein OMCYN_01256 [cyanobiont of Ornithocercus magnificus]
MRVKVRWLICISGVLGILVVTSLVLQMMRSLLWSLNYLLPYWLAGPVLLLISILTVFLTVQVGWPWWQVLQRLCFKTKRTNIKLEPPLSYRKAAEQSLDSIDCILERLKSDVDRKTLRQQRQRLAHELEQGDLVVVVFGAVSSGKTSLIRALMQEVVGEVRPASNYRLRLRKLSRGVQLVDTPGILESGQVGLQRETQARSLAVRADLLLVVVDGDLQAAEHKVICNLAKLGKRILLVLNKCDLLGEDEERYLLELLYKRFGSLLLEARKDVVACSAAPRSVYRPGCQPLQALPEIQTLMQRIATVLHKDSEELVASNILLQCRRLNNIGRKLLIKERRREAQHYVERYSWISCSVVVATPLPGADLLGTAAVNAQMVIAVANIYEVQLTLECARELAISVGKTLTGLGLVKSSMGLIGTALNLSFPSLLLGRAVQGITAAWLTRVAGSSFITYFEQDQDWGDGGIQEIVQRHYSLNQRQDSLQDFLKTVASQVVEPLQDRQNLRRLLPRQLRQARPLVAEVEEGRARRGL